MQHVAKSLPTLLFLIGLLALLVFCRRWKAEQKRRAALRVANSVDVSGLEDDEEDDGL